MIRLRPRAAIPTGEWLGADALAHLPTVPRRRAREWLERLRRLLDARRLALLAGGALALGGLGHAGYVHAKATAAQWLLRAAWQRSDAGRVSARPWPWADTWPVASLEVPRLSVRQIVLAGASGRTLAFGPAWSPASAEPGTPGVAVLSGHRDTHFRFLEALKIGDHVVLSRRGVRHRFAIEQIHVADARTARIDRTAATPRLTLVTCWPFDAVSVGGPLRYVVEARLVASGAAPD